MAKMKNCASCGKEIASSAKTCPHCGGKNKKPIYLRKWVWLLAVLLVFGIGSSLGGSNPESNKGSSLGGSNPESNKPIEYRTVEVDTLESDLEKNPANAKETYKDQYIEITGRVGVIDADLQYIGIMSPTNEFDFIGIQCYIQNDETKEVVKQISTDQTVTVKGKVTGVGEVLGYSLDIDEVIPQ